MTAPDLMASIVLALLVAVVVLAIVKLNRLPKPRCDKCGEEMGSNDYCENCVDWRAYP